ncbi:MAG: PIG-L family deacetylase [Candidatus Bathyarchaeota archaeon]|nr:PIG-L family deacetylase [Candidatus Bathyarchaeota archaeon]
MLKFRFLEKSPEMNVLCLGAHPDDIEIGCGGTILKLIEEVDEVHFNWIVFSGDEKRVKEAQKSANTFINKKNLEKLDIKNFRESYFPYDGAYIKDYFEELKAAVSPNIIFTHYRNDAHQDHRLISDLTWNTFRDNFILEYEVPKYDGDLGSPNLFVHLDESIVEKKIETILDVFKTQANKMWFTKDTFKSILRIRGVESNSPSKYAEAFYCHKIVF